MAQLFPRVRATRFVAHRALGAITLALVAALLGWAPAPPAAAHGELVSSDPSEGGLVEAHAVARLPHLLGRDPRGP